MNLRIIANKKDIIKFIFEFSNHIMLNKNCLIDENDLIYIKNELFDKLANIYKFHNTEEKIIFELELNLKSPNCFNSYFEKFTVNVCKNITITLTEESTEQYIFIKYVFNKGKTNTICYNTEISYKVYMNEVSAYNYNGKTYITKDELAKIILEKYEAKFNFVNELLKNDIDRSNYIYKELFKIYEMDIANDKINKEDLKSIVNENIIIFLDLPF